MFPDEIQVRNPVVKLGNLVACALIKEIHFLEDCFGEEGRLYYLKNKEGKEIDFLVTRSEASLLMLEVKWQDNVLSPNFAAFEKYFSNTRKIQLVKALKKEKTYFEGPEIRAAHKWLAGLDLSGRV